VNAANSFSREESVAQRIALSTRQDEDSVYIDVRDTGSGISEKDLLKIFDPFFTTRSGRGGTGLGLSICAEIVHALSGEILVESRLREGATFTVRLPRHMTSGPPSARPTELQRRSVLVVDDDPLVLKSIERNLSRYHDVSTELSGEEALDLLSNGATFDLILCDVIMPRMDGPALFEQVAARHPSLRDRFVFISAVRKALANHASGQPSDIPFIAKPVDLSELLALIRRSVEEADLARK
jgi:CheY-like chemotaxis protein